MTVNLTFSGTAAVTADYTRSGTSILIPAGSTTGSITLTAVEDALDEMNETIIAEIDSVMNGTESGTQQATVTITDDDAAPTVTLAAIPATVAEAAGGSTVTATLSAVSGLDVTVNLAFGGTATWTADYIYSGTSILIPAGSTSGSITLTAVQDVLDELNETIIADIDSVMNGTELGTQQATVTITDDDAAPTVTLAAIPATVAEAAGGSTVTATLSAVSGLDVTVNLAFSGTATLTTDYTRSGMSILIPADSTTGSITLTAVQDAIDELNETIVVDISTVTNGTESGTRQVTVTITDDDAAPTVTLVASPVTVAEAAGGSTVTATLSAVSGLDVTVNLAFGGTATLASDYTRSSTSILIPAGSTSASITLTAVQDTIDELDETMIVDISTVTNGTESGTQQVTVTITDDDAAPTVTLAASPATVAEAAGGATVTATLSAVSGLDVTVNLAFSGSAALTTDYTRSGTSILIPAGSTTVSITLTAVQDVIDELDETILVDISTVTNGTESGTQQVTVTILDDDAAPTVTLAANPLTVAEAAGGSTVAATLSAVPGLDVTVNLAFGGTATLTSDYTRSGTSILIPAGSTTGSIMLTAVQDTTVEATETIVVDIDTVANGTETGAQQVTATITDDDTATFVINDVTVLEGGTLSFTISLSKPIDTMAKVNVSFADVSTSASDFTHAPVQVTFAANTTTPQTALVATVNDTTVELTETFTAALALDGTTPLTGRSTSLTDTGIGTITNDDTATVSIVANDPDAAEPNDDGQFTVSMTAASELATVVSYTVAGTATEGTDYVSLVPHQVTIPAGATSATHNVDVLADSIWDNNETVVLTLNSVIAGVTSAISIAAAPNNSSVVTIKDPTIAIVDNHDPGFEDSGFLRFEGVGYLSDWAYGGNSYAAEFARWTFDALPGSYRVSVTWPNYNTAPKATNAPFSVYNGTVAGPLLATVLVNQSGSPRPDVADGSFWFQDLNQGANQGIYTITGNKLTVQLTDIGINGLVFADAVRIERLLAVQAEPAVATSSPAEFEITNAEVAPLVQRAIDTWTAADQNAQGRLSNVNLVIGQLPGSVLGLASEATSTIWLDSNGAGSGWQLESYSLRRGEASLPSGQFDLFTVVAHELGHLLGYGDLDPLARPDALMASHLSVGTRRLPVGMGLDTLPRALTAPVAKDAYFVDFGRSSNSAQDDLFGLVLEPNSVREDAENSESPELSTSKPDPKDGSLAVTAALDQRHAASGTVIGRKHEALVDEFFDRIDDELLRPEANITDAS